MNANVNNNKNKAQKNFKITPEMLKNGEVLNALVLRFLNNRNKENMFSLLSCLRDSNVFLAANVDALAKDTVVGGKGDNPVMFPVKQKITITPQIYKATDGKMYIPIFSRKENARQEHLKGASLVNLPFINCIAILKDYEDCSRFVLDPHLYNVVLDEDLIRITQKLPSRLGTQRNTK